MLINKVNLASNSLAKTKAFYLNRLGAKLLGETPNSFSIKIGASELIFTEANSGSKPFYHLAFNIPSNQFKEAKKWITARTPLNREEGVDEVYFRISMPIRFISPTLAIMLSSSLQGIPSHPRAMSLFQ